MSELNPTEKREEPFFFFYEEALQIFDFVMSDFPSCHHRYYAVWRWLLLRFSSKEEKQAQQGNSDIEGHHEGFECSPGTPGKSG